MALSIAVSVLRILLNNSVSENEDNARITNIVRTHHARSYQITLIVEGRAISRFYSLQL